MNERIKELATQSGIAMIPNSHPISITGLTTDLEKFAESIMRECVKLLEEMPRYYKQESDRQIERDTIFDCARTIKEHFGIES